LTEKKLVKKNQKNISGTINEESYQALLADIVGLIKEAQRTSQILSPKAAKTRASRVLAKKKPKARKP
jgi:hypothetical protein